VCWGDGNLKSNQQSFESRDSQGRGFFVFGHFGIEDWKKLERRRPMTPRIWQRRAEIDEIDQRLLDLLNQRARIVEDIGKLKREHRMPVLDGTREAEVLRRLRAQNQGPLDTRSVAAIFRSIIRESRRIQESRA
jgi:chorismate mutase-like protein